MRNKEYRIIFYKDKRYNMIDRYVIVGGKFTDAIAMVDSLKKSDFAADVSNYTTVNGQYVWDQSHYSKRPIRFKSGYQEMGQRKFWIKNL